MSSIVLTLDRSDLRNRKKHGGRDRFHPGLENIAEMSDDAFLYVRHPDHPAEEGFDRRSANIGKTARVDEIETGKIRIDVERKTVKAYPSSNGDSDETDLFAPDPHPSVSPVTRPEYTRIAERSEHYFLEPIDETCNTRSAFPDIDDRITDELARAVIGYIPSPFSRMAAYPPGFEDAFAYPEVFLLPSSSEGKHVGVFDQTKRVRTRKTCSCDMNALLKRGALREGHRSKIDGE
jgi:hypothetical protein